MVLYGLMAGPDRLGFLGFMLRPIDGFNIGLLPHEPREKVNMPDQQDPSFVMRYLQVKIQRFAGQSLSFARSSWRERPGTTQ